MTQYFIYAVSCAFPFFSGTDTQFQPGKSPEDAMTRFRRRYDNPAGLFSAALYRNREDFLRRRKPLLICLSDAAKKAAGGTV